MSKPVVHIVPKPEAAAPQAPARKPRRRAFLTLARASVIVAGIGLAVVVPLGWGGWVAGLTNQTTNNATLHADLNLGVGGPHVLWGGTGFAVYSGVGLGNNFHLAGGVFRMTTPQTLSFPGKIFVLAGGVFEIGADLNGATAEIHPHLSICHCLSRLAMWIDLGTVRFSRRVRRRSRTSA